MASRRSFLAGMIATGLAPVRTWADAGSPAILSAGRTNDGIYVLCGLTADADIVFSLPLPGRGHAAAAHPTRPEAVAFARRPGTYAIVIDCVTGLEIARINAPHGRHFYGHGTFSPDGSTLFTTENDFSAASGVVGIWDAQDGFVRIGEISSGGVGPHDVKLMPNGRSLVVANGGIETHPETGRLKLNIPTMRSNLSYLGFDGEVLDQLVLDSSHQRNSIRHLAVSSDGTVAFAMQWQGDVAASLPLLGTHRRDIDRLTLFEGASVRRMNGYLGSVAFSKNGARIATTSPRAGRIQEFDGVDLVEEASIEDVCGVVAVETGFFTTTGMGRATKPTGQEVSHPIAWDNHLIAI